MRVLHINFSDSTGGASIAAFRHCEAMRRAGIEAEMLVLKKEREKLAYIHCTTKGKVWMKTKAALMAKLMQTCLKPFKAWGTFSMPVWSVSIARHPAVKRADIIYLHWVAGSMLSTREIERLLKTGKTVRWYMHDMNPITGGCHYAMECEKYRTACRECPLLKKHFRLFAPEEWQFNLRMKHWKKYKNLEAYTPSEWLGECVRTSLLWQGHTVKVFPNVIDLKKFHPCNKQAAKDLLGIRSDRKLVLFGAAGVDSAYKGWGLMREALNRLNPEEYEAVIFGEENEQVKRSLQIACHFTGYLHDEYSLILAYNAADVFVSSSLADNYPNVIMEAMACGLPCVGFEVGGIPDQIKHLHNGFLAEKENPESLAEGIRYVCEAGAEDYSRMQKAARSFTEQFNSYDQYQTSKW